MRICVVYALPDEQALVELEVPVGTSVAEAIELSGLRRRYPQIPTTPPCAIYGRSVQPVHAVREGDRIEILRPLLIDPKESRRRAASRTSGR